jgi:tRNA-dihydrouridine synthase
MAQRFTFHEDADIHLVYGEVHQEEDTNRRFQREKFHVEAYSRELTKNQKLRQFGHLNINNLDRGRSLNDDHVERDEEILQENRNKRIRQLSRIVGTLHNENKHPYHYT